MHSDDKPHLGDAEERAINDEIAALEFDRISEKLQPTANDVHEMQLFGIQPVFKRRFKFVAMLGFNSLVVLSWQNSLATFQFALDNGGTGGYFFTFLYGMCAFGFVYLSLAELASSYPTAGGQYQWVAQCAPLRFRRGFSYFVGWLCSLAWLGYLAGCGVIIGNQIHSCVLIYHPDSSAANSQWFSTTFALTALIVGGLFNARLARQFPIFEGIMVCVHFAGWVAFIVVLWVTSPIGEPQDVILSFNNGGGWVSPGGAALIGVLTATSGLLGYDSAVHMTENAKDASHTIPWSLVLSYFGNALMGFAAGVTVIFCAGDLDQVLSNGTQQPWVTIFYNSTGSKAGTVIMITVIMMCTMASQISDTATACRQIWAFARDDGLPFSHRLKQVPDAEVPQTALWTVIAGTFLITCINFISSIGLNAITSLVSVSLTCSYIITISCVLWQRWKGGGLPKARFSLGKAGVFVNILALCTMSPIVVIAPFPPVRHVTAKTMNYAVVVFSVVVIFSTVNYFLVGRKRFKPVLRKSE